MRIGSQIWVSHSHTSSSDRATSTDPHFRAIEMRTVCASMAVDTGCCVDSRHQSLLLVSGHVHVSRGTFLGDAHCSTLSLASGLCCGVTVAGLRAHGTLLVKSEAVVRELTVATRIDRDTIHKLLLAQKYMLRGDDGPVTFERTRGQIKPNTSRTAPGSSPVSLLPSRSSPPYHRWVSDALMRSQVPQGHSTQVGR